MIFLFRSVCFLRSYPRFVIYTCIPLESIQRARKRNGCLCVCVCVWKSSVWGQQLRHETDKNDVIHQHNNRHCDRTSCARACDKSFACAVSRPLSHCQPIRNSFNGAKRMKKKQRIRDETLISSMASTVYATIYLMCMWFAFNVCNAYNDINAPSAHKASRLQFNIL